MTVPPLTHGQTVVDLLCPTWAPRESPYGLDLNDLAGLAVRKNPKRAQLVVSRVLGKHVPASPAAVRATGLLLGEQVHAALTGDQTYLTPPAVAASILTGPPTAPVTAATTSPATATAVLATRRRLPSDVIVLGFCETATALGHVVADAFRNARYVHTTRRPDPDRATYAGFDEEHSHAVGHLLQPYDGLFSVDWPVVLVDDELTTGTTALNTIDALQQVTPRRQYVIATLLDLRDDTALAAFEARAAAVDATITVVSLLSGSLTFPPTALTTGAKFAQTATQTPATRVPQSTAAITARPMLWQPQAPTGARHGFTVSDRILFEVNLQTIADDVATDLSPDPRVLVLGTEELMYLPVRLAHRLELTLQRPGCVLVQSTTRSPVTAHDADGYAIRRTLTFPAPDDPDRDSWLHNVAPLEWEPSSQPPYTDIVVVVDAPARACKALLVQLVAWASDTVHLIEVPSRRDPS